MIYSFVTDKGEQRELWFSMAEVPSIGDTIEVDGETLTRTPACQPQLLQQDIDRKFPRYPYVSHALPRNLPGCECDAKGKPIVKNKRHEREIASRYGYEKL